MQSEPSFVWTLIQSFSLAKKGTFEGKPFGVNFEINNDKKKADWNGYRLSLSQMQSLADHSTHLRATCNFPTDGLQYTDYARAKLSGHNIFGNWTSCQMYEYVNIRGINRSNCTALTRQKSTSWTIRSYGSKEKGCEFDGTPGGINREYNFGEYGSDKMNPTHCTSSNTSTTQHWFGAKYDV